MKVSKKSIKYLSSFRTFSEQFILTPTGRFFIFGEGKERIHASTVIESKIKETSGGYTIFDLPKSTDVLLNKSSKQNPNPEKKIHFFDELLSNTKEIASFSIDLATKKQISVESIGATHIRLWGRDDGSIFARSFDARRYYSKSIKQERNKFKLYPLSDFNKRDFLTYIEHTTFKRLKNDRYGISVLSNGIMIFDGIETGLTYYIKDQKLGTEWVKFIKDSVIEDNVLSFDPRRVLAIHRKRKAQN